MKTQFLKSVSQLCFGIFVALLPTGVHADDVGKVLFSVQGEPDYVEAYLAALTNLAASGKLKACEKPFFSNKKNDNLVFVCSFDPSIFVETAEILKFVSPQVYTKSNDKMAALVMSTSLVGLCSSKKCTLDPAASCAKYYGCPNDPNTGVCYHDGKGCQTDHKCP